jgi:putative hydrolase of the HAD superfamily
MNQLTTIGFDADDTLWHHEKYFVSTKERFVELLSPYADGARAGEQLPVPNQVIGAIIELGREMLVHPVDPFPGVRETLEALKPTHKLLVVTRGDLFDQERKLAASGLMQYFDEIEIVSDKTALVYDRIFTRHGDGPQRSMMIGNSMRADVVPAIEAGAWGIHVPSEHVWSMDLADDPKDTRFRRLPDVASVVELVATIG